MEITELGKYNYLKIVREVDFGFYLDGGQDFGEILMPKRYITEDMKIGDFVTVFVYLDGEERLVATNEEALAEVGQVAYLKARSVSEHGAFLDWGIMKDLFLPFKEQNCRINSGHSYFVYVYIDSVTDRITATMRVDKHLDLLPHKYKVGEELMVRIFKATDLGFKAIINRIHSGMIYKNEIHVPIQIGNELKAYVKYIREDGKIDLALQKQGSERIFDSADLLYQALLNHEGFLPLTDKTAAEVIYQKLGISKKTFKQALGKLYKEGKVVIEDDGFRTAQNISKS